MFQLYQFWEHWFPKSLVVPTVCSKWITIFFSWSHLWTDNDTSLRTRLQHSSKKKAKVQTVLAFSDFGNRNHICRISWIYYNSHIHFFRNLSLTCTHKPMFAAAVLALLNRVTSETTPGVTSERKAEERLFPELMLPIFRAWCGAYWSLLLLRE